MVIMSHVKKVTTTKFIQIISKICTPIARQTAEMRTDNMKEWSMTENRESWRSIVGILRTGNVT